MNKVNVVILYGGESLEKEVSKITGMQIINNLNKSKYNIYPIFIDEQNIWWYTPNIKTYKELETTKKYKAYIKPGESFVYFNKPLQNKIKIHCAIICLHGGNGENGTISGLLNLSNIPYTCSNITASNVTLNKYLTKLILEKNDLNVLPYVYIDNQTDNKVIENFIENQQFPLIVKPVDMGSSIGVSLVHNKEDLFDAIKNVFSLTSSAIIEKGIEKVVEYNCSAMQERDEIVISDIEKPIKKSSILTYAEKYGSKGFKLGVKNSNSKGFSSLGREFPAKISNRLTEQIKQLTHKAYKIFNCSGIIRCDYLYYNKKLYLNEINSIPGSFAFYLWKEKGYSLTTLLDNIITSAIFNHNKH